MSFGKNKIFFTSRTRGMRAVGGYIVAASLLIGALATTLYPGKPATAAPSAQLNFQARLLTSAGAPVPDGFYNIQFNLYAASTGGTTLWTESWIDTNGVTAGNDYRVRVTDGYLSVYLGTLTALPAVDWGSQHFITMNVGGTAQTATPTYDGEMLNTSSERMQLTAVPYAFAAANVGSGDTNAASTNTNAVSISTGDALGATSNSGNILIDTGTATGTAGAINIGTTNASAVTIGRTSVTTTLQGNVSIATGGSTNGVYYRDSSGNVVSTAAGSSNECLRATTGAAPSWGSCSGTGDIIQNGNSFTAAMVIGTNDAFNLQLETGGTTRLTIDTNGDATLTGELTVSGTGTSVIGGDLQVNGGDITTTAGDLTIAPAGADTFITGDLEVSANITTLGNTTLGDATSDTVTFTGRVNSNIEPSANDTYDLGTPTLIWSDIYTNQLCFDGNVDCVTSTAALNVSGWTDGGAVVALTTGTDNVTVGSTSNLGKLAVDGDADEVQLLVQGNATQTSDLFVVETSGGTDILSVDTNGVLVTTPTGGIGLQVDAVATGNTGVRLTGPSGYAGGNYLELTQTGVAYNLMQVDYQGRVNIRPVSDTGSTFVISDAGGTNTVLAVDTSTGFVSTSGSFSAASGLYADNLTLNTGSGVTYATPGGASVSSKINIVNEAAGVGANNQVVAMGINSSSDATARVLSLFDQRAGAHQPSLAVFSPDESDVIGFSWEGSNTTAYLKTLGDNIGLRINTTDIITMTSSAITLVQNATASGSLTVDGNTTLGNANTDTLTINAGTSGTGIRFADSSFFGCTALETDGSGDLTCGTDAGAGTTLQNAYDAGNTILTTDGRDVDITLANTATDPNFTIDIATGSTGVFAIQDNGTNRFVVSNTAISLDETTIDIGTSVATTINVGSSSSTTTIDGGNVYSSGNTAVLSGNTFTVQSGATSLTGPGTSATTLTVNNHTGTGTIVEIQDAATPVFTIADGGDVTAAQNVTVQGNTTLGNASGDAITFNASTLAIPNNLNVDSNTLYIDSTNNFVNIGSTTSDTSRFKVDTSYGSAVAGEQRAVKIETEFTVADTGIKQGLRVTTNTTNTSGAVADLAGGLFLNQNNGNGGSTTNSYGLWVRNDVGAGHTVGTAYGVNVFNSSNSGTLTTQYGIRVSDMTAGTNDIGIAIVGADTQVLWLSSGADNTDAENGIAFGASRDTNLYRSAANTLMTDDSLTVGTDLTVNGNTTLGNASGDTLTLNGTAVTVTNSLNFDSDTLYLDSSNNRIGIGTASPDGKLEIAGNATQSAWGLNGSALQVTAGTYTDSSTAISGTATNAVFTSFATPTLAATNTSVTTTNAATVYVQGSPTAGTNQTITNAYSLWVDSGSSRFDGSVFLQSNASVDGNTTLGNATSDTITFTGRVASTVNPTTNDTYDLGSSALIWNDVYVDRICFDGGSDCATSTAALNTSGWTDDGTVVRLTTATDNVTVGSATDLLANLAIDGNADEIQLLVQANGTQTSTNLAVFETSGGTDLVTISGAGNTAISTTVADTSEAASLRVTSTATSITNEQNGIYASLTAAPASGTPSRTYNAIEGQVQTSGATSVNSNLYAVFGQATLTGASANTANIAGGYFYGQNQASVAAANMYGLITSVQNISTGSITAAYGINIQSNTAGSGTIGTNYGLLVNAQTAGTSDYGIAIQAADTQTLWVSQNANNTTAAAGIAFGSSRDTNLYRSAADTLMTDDSLTVGTNLSVNGNTTLGNATSDTITFNGRVNSNIEPSADDTYALGSASLRWSDVYVGPSTVHIGSTVTDEGTISYNTSTNILQFGTDATTNGDIAFFTDDLYLDKSAGRVGIGTATVDANLHIYTGSDTSQNFFEIQGATDNLMKVYSDGSANTIFMSLNDVVQFAGPSWIADSDWVDAKVTIEPNSATQKALVIDAYSGQTADLLQIRNAIGPGNIFAIDNDGSVGLRNGTPANLLNLNTPNTANGVAEALIYASAGTQTGLVIQENSGGQSAANLIVENGFGTDMFTIHSSGYLTVQNTADATQAYVFRENGGNTVLNIDTTNERVGIGNNGSLNSKLHIYTGSNTSQDYFTLQGSTTLIHQYADGSGNTLNENTFRYNGFTNTAGGNPSDWPFIKLYTMAFNGSSKGLVVQANDFEAQTADLFQVRTNGASAGDLFVVTANGRVGVAGATTPSYDVSFGEGANRTVGVEGRASNAAGRNLTVSAGAAGAGASAFTGGTLTLQGGAAGGTGNANGGSVTITGGAGTGTGVQGLVNLSPSAFTASTTVTLSANGNLNTLLTNATNIYSTVPVNATSTGYTLTVDLPTVTTVGRILYIAAVNGSSDFTLSLAGTSVSISMKANSTATLIYNGTGWTAAGASSSTDLQAAYNNTLSSAGGAEIVLNNTSSANGLTIRNNASSPIIGGIIEAQTSIGSNLFSVNNNATEYASNGGAETAGGTSTTFPASTWAAAPGGGTVARYIASATNIATGQASTSVVTSTTAGHGARNTLTQLTNNLKYSVSFAIKADATSFSALDVMFSSDGTTGAGLIRHCVTGVPTYSTGTASQTGTTITGSGTTFTAGMVGSTFVFANGASAVISGYTSATSLTASQSQSVSSTTYGIYAAGYTVNTGIWSRVTCNFTAPSSGITSGNSIFIRQTDTTGRTFYVDNLSVTVGADVNHAVDGSVDLALGSNWTNFGTLDSLTRNTSILYDTGASVEVNTPNAVDRGVRNNMAIAPTAGTQYLVTFYARSTNTFNDIRVRYSRDGGSNFVSCGDYNTQSVSTTGFTRITCIFTTDGTTATDADLIIDQPTGSDRSFYIDSLSVTLNTNTANNVQIGGANRGGPTTLFTLDRGSSAPIAANNDAYLGSMYYDTTTGRIQCYEADGWGACGSAPDNYVNLNPEYAGAVLNATANGAVAGVGTMTSDFCANQTSILTANTGLCASGESRNYYKWTSPQLSQQTYSILVSYQLPSTFKQFASDDTVQLTARVDNTTNAAVTYEMYRSENGVIAQCGTGETAVTSVANTWQTVGISGNESTSCGFSTSSANAFVIFKINLKANGGANAYVSTLSFTTTGR